MKLDEMLLNVAKDDLISFKNNNEYLINHPKDALLFAQPKETWDRLKNTYNGSFKTLIFGDFPKEKDILETLQNVANRLDKVNWVL